MSMRGRGLDVELHEVDERGAAGEEAHVGALLRGFGVRRRRRGAVRSECGRRVRVKVVSCVLSSASNSGDVAAHLFDGGGDDVGVGAAAADVAGHGFLHVVVGRAAGFFEESDGGHDLAGRAVAALVAVLSTKAACMGCIAGLAEAFDGGDFVAVVHERRGRGRS